MPLPYKVLEGPYKALESLLTPSNSFVACEFSVFGTRSGTSSGTSSGASSGTSSGTRSGTRSGWY